MASSASLPVLPQAAWPTDQVDEHTCKAAGEFFATWMTSPEQIEAKTYRGPGLDATAQYLRVLYGLEDDKAFTDGQLVWWFADTQAQAQMAGDQVYQEFLSTVIQPAVTFCGASVCKSLGWAGNGDLAGIGVFSSYYIEAILATIYMVVLLGKSFHLWGGGGAPGRILGAFLGTLGDLIMGAFVFSLVVVIASLHSIFQVRGDEDFSVTTYEIVTAMLVTVFSVCSATLLYCLAEHGKGPKVLLRAVLFALWALMLAVVNIGRTTDPSAAALQSGTIGHPFELYCQVIGTGPLEAVRIFAVASAGLGALWLVYLLSRKCRSKASETGRLWRAVVTILAWIVMWVFLGVFTALRARSIEVAGASDKSNEWSFGQIVAVAAWVPVLLNFIYILIAGVDGAQNSKLPDGYEVTISTGNAGGDGDGKA
ncbi:hypothetical protein C8A00DRAFT_14475 [Chaetomidium leptoderma]|uniref:Uncharacterized protein n=1 Tax=Chaetomidium leptoderma TaxID=669021 RepID=A0AAN6VQ93_9PEZI|nr:hypothetical protein C8A00DRAFT_14475 [Chaetomidium leptoderma]